MPDQEVPPIEAAVTLAKRGRQTIRLRRLSKLPAHNEWQHRATNDVSVIEADFKNAPQANVGYTLPGLVGIDVDSVEGHGVDGVATWAAITSGRAESLTWTISTPTGGVQYVYTLPDGIEVTSGPGRLGEGVDVKSGPGAYLVGPGSATSTGTYKFADDRDPAPCPPWLLKELRRVGAVKEVGSPPSPTVQTAPSEWQPHGRFGEPVPAGRRHAVILAFCCSMRARRFSWAEAERLLAERWADCAQPPGNPYQQADAMAVLEDVWHRYPSGTDYDDMASEFSEEEASSWTPKDLVPYLDGTVERPEPSVGMPRDDGLHLLYPGREHAVISQMEGGKSWLCVASAAHEMTTGGTVVYIHCEEADPADTVGRLLSLGIRREVIEARFIFVGPEHPVTRADLATLRALAPSLVVIDGVNEAMALHGCDIRDETGAAAFRRLLVKPFTAIGAAVLQADHVVKDPERRGGLALGTVHKGNGLTGSLIELENVEPFGRGRRGRSRVFINKDRPGHLRTHGRPTSRPNRTYMGELVVDDSREFVNYLHVTLYPPPPEVVDGIEVVPLHDHIVEVVSGLTDATVGSERALFAQMRCAGVQARESAIRSAVDDLLASGRLVEHRGARNAKGYRVGATAAGENEPE